MHTSNGQWDLNPNPSAFATAAHLITITQLCYTR